MSYLACNDNSRGGTGIVVETDRGLSGIGDEQADDLVRFGAPAQPGFAHRRFLYEAALQQCASGLAYAAGVGGAFFGGGKKAAVVAACRVREQHKLQVAAASRSRMCHGCSPFFGGGTPPLPLPKAQMRLVCGAAADNPGRDPVMTAMLGVLGKPQEKSTGSKDSGEGGLRQ